MTGAASVESKHAFETIKLLFAKEMLVGSMTQSKKAVWHNFCLAKAGVEVFKGGKMKKADQATKLQEYYDRWARHVCSEDGVAGITFELPDYVTMKMFMTKDINNLTARADTKRENGALWRQ